MTFCIGMLDSQTSMDRGTLPLTPVEDFACPPSTINDADLLHAGVTHPFAGAFTDMSFFFLIQEATGCARKLCAPVKDSANPYGEWNDKIYAVATFEETMHQHCYLFRCYEDPLARFTKVSAEHISLNMHLLLRRPPYRRKHSPVPPWDDFNILEATTQIMERILIKATDPDFAPWAWFTRSWGEWYALSVLLTELCSLQQGELADRAYAVAQEVFNHYSDQLQGANSAVLWKPIAKLMRKVKRVRGVQESTGTSIICSTDQGASDTELLESPIHHAPSPSQGQQLAWNSTKNMPTLGNTYAAPVSSQHQNRMMEAGNDLDPGADMSWNNWDLFLNDMYPNRVLL